MLDTLTIASHTFTRIDTDDTVACWVIDRDDDVISIVIEPAGEPDKTVLDGTATVIERFDELTQVAAEYLREHLTEPQYALSATELELLAAPETPFEVPEIVMWGDGTWMLRFAQSPLGMADPFGVGVLFAGLTPVAVEDLSDAEDA